MLMNNNEYLDLVQTIKQEIQQAQYKATLSVNKELIMLYYNIGKIINEHKSWGNKFIENLAADIKLSFPNAKGYSVRNLKYMSKFVSTYPDEQFVQTVSAQIPWSHNVAILDKVKGEKQREWYIRKTAENGWSHNVLIHQIESGLYERQAIADKISNFESRLASPQSELAVQTMKDPYIFDFIPFKEDTTARVPTIAPLPMVTPDIITASYPIHTSLPITMSPLLSHESVTLLLSSSHSSKNNGKG